MNSKPNDLPPPYSPQVFPSGPTTAGPQAPPPGFVGAGQQAPPPGFAGAGPQAPPPGFVGAPPQGYSTSYGSTIVMPPQIIVIGGCPACRIGILEESYSCLALFCAIAFFPIGLLCCLAMRNKQCSNCGAVFG